MIKMWKLSAFRVVATFNLRDVFSKTVEQNHDLAFLASTLVSGQGSYGPQIPFSFLSRKHLSLVHVLIPG